MILKAFFSFDPITILSGYLKSRIASPSRKNSGFEITVKSFFFFFKIFSISSPVPTGTVDLVTIIFFLFEYLNISFVHLLTKDKSTLIDPFLVGVPTHIKIISDVFIALSIFVVNESRLAVKFFFIN